MRKAEPLGILDHHDGGLRDIDADFHHRRRHQQLNLARGELRHDAILLRALHLAMDQADPLAEAPLQRLEALGRVGKMGVILRVGFFHQRADPVSALACVERPREAVHDLSDAALGYGAGVDRLAARGLLAQFGNVHVAKVSEHQRARDRRGAQHQHVHRIAFLGQRKAFAHAEAVLFVDDGQRERLEHHIVLDQRMGADQKIDLAVCELFDNFAAFLAFLAAGQDRDLHPGTFCQRRNRLDVLAGEDFGRRHQGRLLAGFRDGGRSEQRHHGLAGADVALQQAQHPQRLVEVVGDGFRGLLLRWRQCVGQRVDDLVTQMSVARIALTRRAAELRAHQRQRQLPSQEFVEGEARPERVLRQDVGEFARLVNTMQRFGNRRKRTAPQHFGTDPFRQAGQLGKRLRHGAADRADGEAFGERIDRIDLRQLGEAFGIDHTIRMHDLQGAVEDLRGAGDETRLAHRQQLFDVVLLGAEEGQDHIAGLVACIDQIGRAGPSGRRGPMPVDGDFQRHHLSDQLHGLADCRPRAAIDHIGRQMQQQVHQPRRFAAVEQIAEQLVLFRPDAGEARNGCEQRIEQGRTHSDRLKWQPCRRFCISRMQGERNADIHPRDGYISLPGSVRAFCVGKGAGHDGNNTIERWTR